MGARPPERIDPSQVPFLRLLLDGALRADAALPVMTPARLSSDFPLREERAQQLEYHAYEVRLLRPASGDWPLSGVVLRAHSPDDTASQETAISVAPPRPSPPSIAHLGPLVAIPTPPPPVLGFSLGPDPRSVIQLGEVKSESGAVVLLELTFRHVTHHSWFRRQVVDNRFNFVVDVGPERQLCTGINADAQIVGRRLLDLGGRTGTIGGP
jgi:hypothetical protein